VSATSAAFDRFQAELLVALAEGAPADAVRDLARDLAPDEAVAAWVDAWDPDLVTLAGELVATWGRRSPDA
jgi:hypothetical protein